MKKRVKTYKPNGAIGRWADCPFCGLAQDVTNPLSWCAGCFCEYTLASSRQSALFDQEKRTERFGFAKAIGRAGGMHIGARSDESGQN